MKRHWPIPLFVVVCLACGWLWGPTATVKKFMAAAQKNDPDTMTSLFSRKAIERLGLERIQQNNKLFAEASSKSNASQGPYSVEEVKEIPYGDTTRVSFVYRNKAQTDAFRMVFDLSKEGSAWKIDDLGGAEKLDAPPGASPSPSIQTASPEPTLSPTPEGVKQQDRSGDASNRAPISGGVLNSKAIVLPKPSYPPVARAMKASGTVTVQVTVDEKGNVISAHAVSGHPLLQAVAVEAARKAKFQPTLLSGQPVKVTGIITYNFVVQ